MGRGGKNREAIEEARKDEDFSTTTTTGNNNIINNNTGPINNNNNHINSARPGKPRRTSQVTITLTTTMDTTTKDRQEMGIYQKSE